MGRGRLALVAWPGGKGRQLNELLGLIPYTQTFVEPFGGGAAVLLNRRPSPVEVYNDLDGDLVNLFQVVRCPELFSRWETLVELTMYSRDEFRKACAILNSPNKHEYNEVARAWAMYTAQNQSYGGNHKRTEGQWSRSVTTNSGASRWWSKYDTLVAVHTRLRNVQIESSDAVSVIETWDTPDTTFYIDPPYVLDTRAEKYYQHEMEDEDHKHLIDVLLNVEGAVVLSGYDHPIYWPLVEAGWHVTKYEAHASSFVAGNGESMPVRTEYVWRNPVAVGLGQQQTLFA